MKFLLREPDAANPHVRFDERDVETEHDVPPRHVSTLPRRFPPVLAELHIPGLRIISQIGHAITGVARGYDKGIG